LPHRFDKKGELLIDYADTEQAIETERRRSSVTGAGAGVGHGGVLPREQEEKSVREHRENDTANGGAL
jgi:hypothetical protein